MHENGGRAPEAFPGGPDRVAPRGLVPHVQVNVLGSLAQLGGHRGALVVAHIRHYDAGTFSHEAAGGSGADAARGPRHQGDAPGEAARGADGIARIRGGHELNHQ